MKPLNVTFFGQQLVATPVAVMGLGLHCSCAGGLGPLLVHEGMCANRDDFWASWRALGGESQGIELESGEPFAPPLTCAPAVQAARPAFAIRQHRRRRHRDKLPSLADHVVRCVLGGAGGLALGWLIICGVQNLDPFNPAQPAPVAAEPQTVSVAANVKPKIVREPTLPQPKRLTAAEVRQVQLEQVRRDIEAVEREQAEKQVLDIQQAAQQAVEQPIENLSPRPPISYSELRRGKLP